MLKRGFFAGLAAVLVAVAAPWPAAAEAVRVGITPTGVPFTFVDTATQKPAGAMVDLATAIAADAGLTAEFQVNAFPALIPALTTDRIDLISASMFVTEKRKEVIDFSTPVYSYGEIMFVSAQDPKNYKIAELKGGVIGAPIGSTFADALQKLGLFKEVKLYDSIADIVRDVRLGRIKAGFGDRPIVAYQLAQQPDLGVRLVEGYQPMKEGQIALAVAKNNPKLLQAVNTAIDRLQRSGQLQKIFARYGL
ncbi:ABC transporter substrate-binding protein [Mesorhizobium sp. B1-1-8]|uniref:ABC transporter substrate-binding protein n=1 Tax=Mesorhizobium sp. B1-1-8 TaxID=2589976 RepID=UPI00112DEDC2|nr:ABC transporter substrate-binding protein [Mesorhizobium sp. B1-1-8]UCI10560.1 ABC transporter substrate-binding protein [Mesorhizobium sp. B1-1-8]